MRSRMLAAVAAAALVAGSSGAAFAQSAAPLSIAHSPAAQATSGGEASALRGNTRWIVGAVALGLIIWGAIELFGGSNDGPASP